MSSEATRLKEEGNACFKEKRYHKAIELYTKSLEANADPLVLGNRAQAYINVKRWPAAVMDCDAALLAKPDHAKALFRRAVALEARGLCALALSDVERCLRIADDPAAKTLKEKLDGKPNVSVMPVYACARGDEIRCDEEWVEVAIEGEEEEEKSVEKEQQPCSSTLPMSSLTLSALPPPPSTFAQFHNHFALLEKTPNMFAEYFMSIPVSQLSSLLGDLVEVEHVSCLLRGMEQMEQGVEEKMRDSLVYLSSIPRFELLAMFLEDEEKRVLESLCSRFSSADSLLIRQKFGLA